MVTHGRIFAVRRIPLSAVIVIGITSLVAAGPARGEQYEVGPLSSDEIQATRGRAETPEPSPFLDAQTFGQSGRRLLKPRIIGGTPAPIGAYPWIVSLSRADLPVSVGHFCGGSLVSAQWIVTAAHCLRDISMPEQINIKYGSNYLSSGGIAIRATSFKVNPNWNASTFENDVAVVKLERPVPDPLPAVLLNQNDSVLFYDGVLAFVAGWGRTSEGGPRPDELRHVGVQIVSQQTCSTPQSYGDRIKPNMFCAGFVEGGRDSCSGDSGGPIMVSNRRGGYVLAGLVSWGEGCARPNKYGVYTLLATYRSWIVMETK